MAGELFAFVLMPFGVAFEDVYRLGIKAAAEDQGFRAERVDEQVFIKESILARIYEQIKVADVVIADMTGRNPNVFYEVGYAHASGKNCILITEKTDDIPFDLKHHRHIIYGSSIATLKARLSGDLSFLKAELAGDKGPFRVEIADSVGSLEKKEAPDWRNSKNKTYYLWGEVDFKLKIYNTSLRQSPEIEDLFIYTGDGWAFSQDKSSCIRMESDIPSRKFRHVLKCPHKRVTRESWIEVKFQARKLLETSKSPITKDDVTLKGTLLIRINTSDDTYDTQIVAQVECTDFPF